MGLTNDFGQKVCMECNCPKEPDDGTTNWAHGWVAHYKDHKLVGEMCHLCQVDTKIKDLSDRLFALESVVAGAQG